MLFFSSIFFRHKLSLRQYLQMTFENFHMRNEQAQKCTWN
jgi:hypothetical protein